MVRGDRSGLEVWSVIVSIAVAAATVPDVSHSVVPSTVSHHTGMVVIHARPHRRLMTGATPSVVDMAVLEASAAEQKVSGELGEMGRSGPRGEPQERVGVWCRQGSRGGG